MRIFYAAPNTAHQSCLPDSKLWQANLYQPLVDLGHELVVFDFDYAEFNYNLDHTVPAQKEFIDRNRPRLGEELLRQLRAAHAQKSLDLFFSYFYAGYVEPEVIREIGGMGITTVNWYCNASYQFYLVAEIAPAYDYCLVPEKFRLDDYRRAGARPIYCQEAANPNVYKPYDVPLEYDVTFVGQKYGNRPAYIAHLIENGVDARAWGPLWNEPPEPVPLRGRLGAFVRPLLGQRVPRQPRVPLTHCGPPLTDEELIKMYSRSRISLGFSSVADSSGIKQVRLRDFEAPMSGAFYMVEEFDELAEFFEPGKEIVFFTTPEDLLEKARYYLRHEAQRRRIRAAGLRRARAEHTWQDRFRMVFREMGLS